NTSQKTPTANNVESTDPSSLHYRQMLIVLKQFRVVIANIKRHYMAVERSSGVGGAQLWALCALAGHSKMTVGELARELAIHQSTASNLLDGLVTQGYVEKRRIHADKRTVTVVLTTQGKRVVKNAPQPAIGILQSALLALPNNNLSQLHNNLAELLVNMGPKSTRDASTPISKFLEK
ncbi:MAG: MarR family winged helix-turn-helix transcriptional regulator, partial [Usitatibacteraceae bacterium]